MAYIRNHMKATVYPHMRERIFIFNRDILGAEVIQSDDANLDLYNQN